MRRTHGMLSARNFGLILTFCGIFRVLPDLTFKNKDTICLYSHVERRFKAFDAFFLEKHVVNAPFIRCSRASRYLAGRVQYSTNGVSTFQIQRNLLVCGDISSNPGPAKGKVKFKFPCGECSKPVRKNQNAILCSSCDTWSHAKCLKLTVTGFKYYLQHPDLEWTCAFCSLPKLSDSFFDETGSFTLNESNCEDEEREAESVDTDEALAKIKDIRIEYRKECVIACLNINSLQNKFDEVRLWLATNAFDILTIQETKIDSTFPSSQFHVDGFNFYRRDRIKGGGGIVVYIRDNIAASRKKLKGKCVESMLFDMKIGQRQFAYITAYKPPSVDNNTFKRELCDLLDEANSFSDNVICTGDLNSDILHPFDNHKEGQCLLDMCDIYDLDSLINVPTRISKNRESCLDVILTNVPAFAKESGVIHTGLSDHDLVYTVLKTRNMRSKAETTTKRSFKTFDKDSFQADLSTVPFSISYVFDDPDDVFWCWHQLYDQVLDAHAPKITVKKRPSPAGVFITNEIRKTMRDRDKQKKQYYRSRNPLEWEKYRVLRNKVVSMRRKAIQNHFKTLCKEKYADQRKFWNTIRPYINSRKKKNNNRIVLKENDQIMREPREVAETLNDFFSNIVGTDKTTERMKDFTHFPHDSASGQITLNYTNPIEVKEIMCNMKTNKAIGYDLIPARAVKDSAEVLCEPFSTLFNYILDVGKIPKQWKKGEITPVYKKDCSLSKDNYRPLTILPSLSKVFETLVHSRVSPRFRNILHKFVFAYRKHHGCDTALLSLTEEWRKELDDRKLIGLVSMDLSKAFDSLPHDLIVKKFKEYGADESTANIIEDYFSDRQQRVKVAGEYSSWNYISRGIAQGSILGPLIFNIFINDLLFIVKRCKLSSYADDTQIFFAHNDYREVESAINSDLELVDKWYDENGLKRNNSKYQAIVMGKSDVALDFKCENSSIPVTKEFEMLGITIDNKLKFDNHVAKICRKVSQQIAVLKRMKKMLPFETRRDLYLAFILPHFNYCSETWNFCSKSAADKLERLNERAIRFVFRDKYTSYSELLNALGLSSLKQQRLIKITLSIFNAVHNSLAPKSLQELIVHRKNISYNLRGDYILSLPKPKSTKYGLNSVRYIGPKLWNSIPNMFRKITNFKSFKRSISQVDLVQFL